ncbi:MAG: YggT family protein [Rhodanobacter sp.]|nr:MAG: YggT family protein [Rhodanobacter sp.]TAM08793.1 MAG: YggT family protein [Rhodanobacter sp.]TAM36835.1 MAG: YggT family protein [Rhodanobacter sp.]
MSYLLNAISLLLGIAFDAVVILFLLRVAAEACRAEFHNPLSQFVYRATNPVLAPMRRVLPNWRRINLAALLVAWFVVLVKHAVLFAVMGIAPHVLGLIVLAAAKLFDFALLCYLIVVFAWALLSMFAPDPRQPFQRLLSDLAAPLVRPLEGRVSIGAIDFSPTIVILVLLLARLLVAAPLIDLGMRLTLAG